MDRRPFALLITWTCYGTWLPGDRRGYVSNTRLADGEFVPKRNVPGTPYTRDDPTTRRLARAAQSWDTVLLTRDQAGCVAGALAGAAAERGWSILRAAVMANHTHVVVTRCPDDGPAVRRVLKGVSQAALGEQSGHPKRWWTQGGSDRYKHDHAAINAAVRYVAEQPGMLAGVDAAGPFVIADDGSARYLTRASGGA